MNRIAVITPYYREPLAALLRCHESVTTQSVSCDHFFVADGHPNPELDRRPLKHVVLPDAHGDGGNTPRGLGCALAESEGYDFITFLDADNWYLPGHIESLLELHHQTGASVCSSFRRLFLETGEELNIAEPAEERLEHVDTSCFFLHRTAFHLNRVWLTMPKLIWPVGDRVFMSAVLKSGYEMVSTKRQSCAYSTRYEFHYRVAGLTPPPNLKALDVLDASWKYLASKQGIDECSTRMRFWPLTYIKIS